jgi:ABC-type uncharacterized transport system permease subunit
MLVKRFRIIVKISAQKFVRYKSNNLLAFTTFLDKKYPGWCWFNVYHYDTRTQISSFTNKDRPRYPYIFFK